jgi:hypothetical protein
MDKEKICKSIQDQLEDIREQFEIIRSYEGKIPSIELDLILSNVREVYEHLLHLEKMNSPELSFSIEEKVKTPEPPPAEPEPVVFRVHEPVQTAVPPPVEEPGEEPAEVEIPEEEMPVVEFIPDPPAIEIEPEIPVVEFVPEEPPAVKPVAEPMQEAPASEMKPAKTTLDLFGESTTTLADKLKNGTEKRMADRFQANRVADLRSAIGINEKFLYINELFDGSLRDYEEAVNKLNGCGDQDDAGMIIFELRERYNWDLDNPAVRSFIELVNRKF